MAGPADLDALVAAVGAALGPSVLAAAAPPSVRDVELLVPAERALLGRAIERRAAEIATGRRLARDLLGRLGVPGWTLLADADRVPVWPPGVVGSISHCEGCCLVAVAPGGAGLGVDVEPAVALELDVWPFVLAPGEWSAVSDGVDVLRRFCAKEAFYKATFPSRRAMVEPSDVVTTELSPGRFDVENVDVAVSEVAGFVVASCRAATP